jgi:hypothetical protein
MPLPIPGDRGDGRKFATGPTQRVPGALIWNMRCPMITFEVFTAVPMKDGVSWDVTPYGSCKNRRSEERSASIIRVTRISELGTTLALTSNRRTLLPLKECKDCTNNLTVAATLTVSVYYSPYIGRCAVKFIYSVVKRHTHTHPLTYTYIHTHIYIYIYIYWPVVLSTICGRRFLLRF